MSKLWKVTVRRADGRTLGTVEVDASTRRAASAAGLARVVATLAGHPGIGGSRTPIGATATAAPVASPARTIVRRLRGRMSGRMAWIMGGILSHDFGARDSHGLTCGSITVTSDGYALGAMGNAFIGAESDIRANVAGLLDFVDATEGERAYVERCYAARVKRWDAR